MILHQHTDMLNNIDQLEGMRDDGVRLTPLMKNGPIDFQGRVHGHSARNRIGGMAYIGSVPCSAARDVVMAPGTSLEAL